MANEDDSPVPLTDDPQSPPHVLAHEAMGKKDFETALSEADAGIAALLREGVSVADFVRRVLNGTRAESLMRESPHTVPLSRATRDPFAIRWEALRRLGRKEDAIAMRTLCIQLWPERASVWASAGNHALEEADTGNALIYFERCLDREPHSIAGLAGKAIVCEQRKDWPSALALRETVVEITQATAKDDAASLHRVIRYAAALARVKRWAEAGVLLRRSVRLGAFAKVPVERSVLLSTFSHELYAPSMIALMLGEGELKLEPAAHAQHAEQAAQLARAIAVAREEAAALGHAYRTVRGDAGTGAPAAHTAEAEGLPATRELMLGVCAWEAGDAELAFKHIDAADTQHDGDITTNYLLMLSAAATRSEELVSIKAFARDTALRVLSPANAGEPASDRDQLYAVLTLMRLGEHRDVVATTMSKPHAQGTFLEMLARAAQLKATAAPDRPAQSIIARPSAPVQGAGFVEQLSGWAAWREIHRSLGHPPWVVAEAFKLGVARRPAPA